MIEYSIIQAPHGIERWGLVQSYMELRKDVFIRRKKWDLLEHENIEFEQYDTMGYATYVVAHEDGQVLAGCRLIRCDSVLGTPDVGVGYTYMIKDAVDGRINLPRELCHAPPPQTKEHWELTRMAAVPGNRKAVLKMMWAAYHFLASQGARGCLCLSSPAVQRLAKISGFGTKVLGPVCGNDDGAFLVYDIAIEAHNHA